MDVLGRHALGISRYVWSVFKMHVLARIQAPLTCKSHRIMNINSTIHYYDRISNKDPGQSKPPVAACGGHAKKCLPKHLFFSHVPNILSHQHLGNLAGEASCTA